MSEDRLIEWLRRELALRGRDRLGDDAAFLPAASWAVSVDQQIEGTHFVAGTAPAVVARRLVAVTLSDLAAVGAEPAHALLAIATPPDFPLKVFFRALLEAAGRHGLELAGGDVARGHRAAFALTVFGRRRGRWVERGSGRPGDRLWVGGALGESAAGRLLVAHGAHLEGRRVALPGRFSAPAALARAARRAVRRHLQPHPQLELGGWLGTRGRAAAIDLSDGLLLDLGRLCRESGVGAVLEASTLPLAPGLERLAAALDQDPLELAATGGEDYVLLFALPSRSRPPAEFGCFLIGKLVEGPGIRWRGEDPGFTTPGWDHLR